MAGFRVSLCLAVSALLLWAVAPIAAEEPAGYLQFNRGDDSKSGPIDPLLDSPEQSPHAGLLGKRYVTAAYVYGSTGGILNEDFLDNAHGFELGLNLPALPGDGTKAFAMDGFVNYRQLFLNDDFNTGTMTISGDGDLYQLGVGVTLYTEAIPRMRPFAQVGWEHNSATFSLSSPVGSFEFEEDDDSFLLNLGTEFDIAETLALRTTLDVDTKEFDSSTFIGEFIISPSQRTFLRLGGFVDLDGEFYGALVGGGLKF